MEEKWAKERESAPIIACPLTSEEKAQIERTVKKVFAGKLSFARRSEQDQLAHGYGVRAKNMGWSKISPYYEDSLSDRFFFAGFDGKSWEQAKREFEEATRELEPR